VTIRSLPFPLDVQLVDGKGEVLAEHAPGGDLAAARRHD
jgi:hypothetical protein